MKDIIFNEACFKVTNKLQTVINELCLRKKELLILVGTNGSGKTLIAKSLALNLPCQKGQIPKDITTALVSFEDQQQLFSDDFKLRNSDNLLEGEEQGITVSSLFENLDKELVEFIFSELNVKPLALKPIRLLSGGEGRRVLIARALAQKPDLLILDTPFDALDVELRAKLLEIIESIHRDFDTRIVLIVNREDEIPPSATKLGIISNLSIVKVDDFNLMQKDENVRTLLYYNKLEDVELPLAPNTLEIKTDAMGNVFTLNKVNVAYERPILKDFSFSLKQGRHLLVTGPNGAGKSTLISLITGDNPLVYTNDITVFGYKRGSGESIWDVKKNFGQVSSSLHLDYRVSCSVLDVILSGLHDSIGLYTQCGDKEKLVAMQYLKIIGLEHTARKSFKTLSFGQQRLVLIARALIKNPALLILDEPLQGLDPIARSLVKSYISYFMKNGRSSVIFVSHHKEDIPEGFDYEINFVKKGDNVNFDIETKKLK